MYAVWQQLFFRSSFEIFLQHFGAQLAKTDPLAYALHLTAEWWKSSLINLVN